MEFVSRRMGSQEVVSITGEFGRFLCVLCVSLRHSALMDCFNAGLQRYAVDRSEGRPPPRVTAFAVPLVRFCCLYRVTGRVIPAPGP